MINLKTVTPRRNDLDLHLEMEFKHDLKFSTDEIYESGKSGLDKVVLFWLLVKYFSFHQSVRQLSFHSSRIDLVQTSYNPCQIPYS